MNDLMARPNSMQVDQKGFVQTEDTITYHFYSFNGGRCVTRRDNETTTVWGRIRNSSSFLKVFSSEIYDRCLTLAIDAINNRTRERNFARLNSNLLTGIISEEEFDRELSEHEDRYVINCDRIPTKSDLEISLQLSREILDVEDTDDLSMLFSFNESSLKPYLNQK